MDPFTPNLARHAVARALWDGTAPEGLPAAQLFEHGTLKLFFYAPRGEDRQPVHDQDEVYVIVRGHGLLAQGEDETALRYTSFGPGDVLFVPACMPHRFEDFSDDFETWVVMYGPPGGERPHRRNDAAATRVTEEPFAAIPANSA